MRTQVVSGPAGIQEAVEALRAGETVALPTETVYGLGANALDAAACARIFEAKERPLFDPLIVHVPGPEWLYKLSQPSELALKLAAAFWPGPLTLVLPKQESVPDIVTSGQDTVAMRMSAHPLFRDVVESFGQPIAAPSANRFGRISPTTPEHVLSELNGRIPLLLDGGPCRHGIESTIVLVRADGGMQILRHGPITAEELSVFCPIVTQDLDETTPGSLKSHYAPRTPLILAEISEISDRESVGLLAWQGSGEGFAQVEYLSPSGDLREAAARLYGAMRRLDEAGLKLIVAEPLPEHGLGVAIMERLGKAAARE